MPFILLICSGRTVFKITLYSFRILLKKLISSALFKLFETVLTEITLTIRHQPKTKQNKGKTEIPILILPVRVSERNWACR